VVIVLAIGPRFACSNAAEDDGFLMAMKILSTTSFGAEVMPTVPCDEILRHVKYPCSMKEMAVGKIHGHSSSFSCLATRCLS
jgi:hypothetical protein